MRYNGNLTLKKPSSVIEKTKIDYRLQISPHPSKKGYLLFEAVASVSTTAPNRRDIDIGRSIPGRLQWRFILNNPNNDCFGQQSKPSRVCYDQPFKTIFECPISENVSEQDATYMLQYEFSGKCVRITGKFPTQSDEIILEKQLLEDFQKYTPYTHSLDRLEKDKQQGNDYDINNITTVTLDLVGDVSKKKNETLESIKTKATKGNPLEETDYQSIAKKLVDETKCNDSESLSMQRAGLIFMLTAVINNQDLTLDFIKQIHDKNITESEKSDAFRTTCAASPVRDPKIDGYTLEGMMEIIAIICDQKGKLRATNGITLSTFSNSLHSALNLQITCDTINEIQGTLSNTEFATKLLKVNNLCITCPQTDADIEEPSADDISSYLRKTTQAYIDIVEDEIKSAKSDAEKISVFVKFIKNCLRLHPLAQANHRVFINIANFLLLKYGVGICLFDERRKFMLNGQKESEEIVTQKLIPVSIENTKTFCQNLINTLLPKSEQKAPVVLQENVPLIIKEFTEVDKNPVKVPSSTEVDTQQQLSSSTVDKEPDCASIIVASGIDASAFFNASDKLTKSQSTLTETTSSFILHSVIYSVHVTVIAEAERMDMVDSLLRKASGISKIDQVRLDKLTKVLELTHCLIKASSHDELYNALKDYKKLINELSQRPWSKIIAGCMVALLSAMVLGLAITAAVASFGTMPTLMAITLLLGGASATAQGISISLATLAIATLCGGLGFAIANSQAPEPVSAMSQCFYAFKGQIALTKEADSNLTLSSCPGMLF